MKSAQFLILYCCLGLSVVTHIALPMIPLFICIGWIFWYSMKICWNSSGCGQSVFTKTESVFATLIWGMKNVPVWNMVWSGCLCLCNWVLFCCRKIGWTILKTVILVMYGLSFSFLSEPRQINFFQSLLLLRGYRIEVLLGINDKNQYLLYCVSVL